MNHICIQHRNHYTTLSIIRKVSMKNLAYESWVNQFVENLRNHFNLAGRQLLIEFTSEDNGSYADITVRTPYQHAIINVYPTARVDFERGVTKQLVMSLTHEVVHVLLDPFCDCMEPHLSEATKPYFINILEQQTQKLTMVFLKTLPKSLIPPRPNGKHNPTPKDNS